MIVKECRTAKEVRDTYRAARGRLLEAAKAHEAHAVSRLVVRTVEPVIEPERRPIGDGPPLRVEDTPAIMRAVGAVFHVSWLAFAKPSRHARVVIPRHVAIYLAYQLTPASKLSLGRAFRRDHSSISWALENIEARMQRDADLAAMVAAARARVLVQFGFEPTTGGRGRAVARRWAHLDHATAKSGDIT